MENWEENFDPKFELYEKVLNRYHVKTFQEARQRVLINDRNQLKYKNWLKDHYQSTVEFFIKLIRENHLLSSMFSLHNFQEMIFVCGTDFILKKNDVDQSTDMFGMKEVVEKGLPGIKIENNRFVPNEPEEVKETWQENKKETIEDEMSDDRIQKEIDDMLKDLGMDF